jgi:hypothetical protein
LCFCYCTLGYDCGLRSDMYCVSLQVFYLGLRLWTSVRYVLCFSSDILPSDTTVVHSRSPRWNTWRETQYISYRSQQS